MEGKNGDTHRRVIIHVLGEVCYGCRNGRAARDLDSSFSLSKVGGSTGCLSMGRIVLVRIIVESRIELDRNGGSGNQVTKVVKPHDNVL